MKTTEKEQLAVGLTIGGIIVFSIGAISGDDKFTILCYNIAICAISLASHLFNRTISELREKLKNKK